MAFNLLNKILTALFFITTIAINANGQDLKNNNLIVIGNKIGTNTLTSSELIDVFKGEKAFWNNKKNVIVVIPNNKHKNVELISKLIYNTSVMGMQKFWLQLVFQGRSNPPQNFENDIDMINFVKNNAGAIAIVDVKYKNDIEEEYQILINNK